jgi:hypothetical protein
MNRIYPLAFKGYIHSPRKSVNGIFGADSGYNSRATVMRGKNTSAPGQGASRKGGVDTLRNQHGASLILGMFNFETHEPN